MKINSSRTVGLEEEKWRYTSYCVLDGRYNWEYFVKGRTETSWGLAEYFIDKSEEIRWRFSQKKLSGYGDPPVVPALTWRLGKEEFETILRECWEYSRKFTKMQLLDFIPSSSNLGWWSELRICTSYAFPWILWVHTLRTLLWDLWLKASVIWNHGGFGRRLEWSGRPPCHR
jgi:hypothetical protein